MSSQCHGYNEITDRGLYTSYYYYYYYKRTLITKARPGGEKSHRHLASNNIRYDREAKRDPRTASRRASGHQPTINQQPEALQRAAESASQSGDLRSRLTTDHAAHGFRVQSLFELTNSKPTHGSLPWDELRVWDPGD